MKQGRILIITKCNECYQHKFGLCKITSHSITEDSSILTTCPLQPINVPDINDLEEVEVIETMPYDDTRVDIIQ